MSLSFRFFTPGTQSRGRRRSARPTLVTLEDRTVPTTFNWVGGDPLQPTWWSMMDNWSPGGIPGPTDNVVISTSAPSVQTIPGEEINNLTLSNNANLDTGLEGLTVDGTASIGNSSIDAGGVITLKGAGTITGPFAWIGGELATSGSGEWTNTGAINVGGSGTLQVTLGGTLNNDGTVTVSSQNFYFDSGVLNNQSDGLFDMEGTGVVIGTSGPSGTFNNSGTLKKAGGADTTPFGVSLNNAAGGIIDVETGTLLLQTAGTSTGGTFTVSTGAVLELTDLAQQTLTGTYDGSGGGTVALEGAGDLIIGAGGATFDFPDGMFQWTGGTIDTTAGTFTNAATGFITLGGSSEIMQGGTLDNLGTITQQPTSELSLQKANAVLDNSGLFDTQEDDSLGNGIPLTGSSEANQAFNNLSGGVFDKSAGTGTATVSSLPFNNSAGATIEVDTGTLDLGGSGGGLVGGGTSTGGTFTVITGAVLNLTSNVSSPTLTGSYTGSGGGTVILTGSTLFIGAGGATFNFPQGMFQWSGGTIDTTAGTLTNAATGFLTLIGDPSISLSGGTLANDGTITQVAGNGFTSTQLFLINGAILDNSGLYDIQEDGTNLTINAASGQAFNNLAGGVFQKSAGTGTTDNGSLPFSNVGTVNGESGTLDLADVAQDDGGADTLTAGTWNIFTNSTLTFSSNDNLTINNGNITLDGPDSIFTNIANLAANNGSFTLEDGQSFTAPGPVANAGILTVDSTGGDNDFIATGIYTQTAGQTVLVAGGELESIANAVTFSAGTLQGTGTVIGNVANTGTVSPGTSTAAGKIAVIGSYTQTAGGTLDVKLGGTTNPGVNYDRLTVIGPAALAGTISVSLINGYTPAAGDVIADVIDFTSKTGDFTTQNGFALGGGLSFVEQFDPASSPVRLNLAVQAAAAATVIYAVGSGPGGLPQVNVYNADGSLLISFNAYASSFTGGVFVAVGDVNGDGVPDIITGAGPGGGPQVKVFDGAALMAGHVNVIDSFYAYASSFTGGVRVAAGDVNDDDKADIVTGAGPGGGPHVEVFDGSDLARLASFYAYASTFTGGVFVAAGDINGDGDADIVTGAGAGGGPHVRVFDGASLAAGGSSAQTAVDSPLRSFYAYDATFTGGVAVAVGNINGTADIITGGGGPPAPAADAADEGRVRVYDATDLTILADFRPYAGFPVGASVAAADVNGDGTADIIIGAGPAGGPNVKVYDGTDDSLLTSFYAFDPTFLGGVWVG